MSLREKIIEIAVKEVGYKEYANNKTKYGDWYGIHGEWCDIFICWLANQVGILNKLIPKSAYVPTTCDWFKKRKEFQYKGYVPQKGDLIFFDYTKNNNPDHIGIVEYVVGNKIHTIEGNKSKKVRRQEYSINDKGIYGFGLVAYGDDDKSIDELAHEVINGKYGTGEARKKALGDKYYAVQQRVNEILKRNSKPVETAKYVKGRYIVNTPKGLNVRKGPSTNYGIKKTYKNGQKFTCLQVSGDWGRTISGWVNLNYCKKL